MRATRRIVWDINTGTVLDHCWVEYSGTWELCKGDNIAKQNEQLQLDLNRQLLQTFQTQFGKQSQITDLLTKNLQPLIDNPQGYSPEELQALRTQTSDTNSGQFNDAQKALNDQLAARGGASTLPSGVDAQLRAQLAEAGAKTEAGSQNQITLNNEELKRQNFFNAVNALSGNAQILNPLGYAGGATAGGNTVANLSQAVTASNQSSLGAALGGIVGGGLSAAGSAGGFRKLFR